MLKKRQAIRQHVKSNTTGVDNSVLGSGAGFSLTTGATNVLLGSGAGNAITTGSGNTGVGYAALGNTNQQRNTAIGYWTLAEATGADNTVLGYGAASAYAYGIGAFLSGSSNVGIGSYALGSLRDDVVSATRNVAVGFEALGTAGSGARNVAVGAGSLTRGVGGSAVNGSDNVALGDTAGDKITTGNQNTVLGSSAASSGTNDLTTGSNNTIIGYNAASSTATISNQITLGNSSIATLRCQVTTITSLSDARDKSNISDLPAGLTFVQGLRPVQFEWSMRDGGKIGVPDTGFIAQDLQAVQVASGVSIPGLVYDDNPDRLEAGYGKLLPVLVKAIQELAAEVETLKAQIAGQ
jgi:hypothetical protein